MAGIGKIATNLLSLELMLRLLLRVGIRVLQGGQSSPDRRLLLLVTRFRGDAFTTTTVSRCSSEVQQKTGGTPTTDPDRQSVADLRDALAHGGSLHASQEGPFRAAEILEGPGPRFGVTFAEDMTPDWFCATRSSAPCEDLMKAVEVGRALKLKVHPPTLRTPRSGASTNGARGAARNQYDTMPPDDAVPAVARTTSDAIMPLASAFWFPWAQWVNGSNDCSGTPRGVVATRERRAAGKTTPDHAIPSRYPVYPSETRWAK